MENLRRLIQYVCHLIQLIWRLVFYNREDLKLQDLVVGRKKSVYSLGEIADLSIERTYLESIGILEDRIIIQGKINGEGVHVECLKDKLAGLYHNFRLINK